MKPTKLEVSLTECCRKGYYLCGHCSRISFVGQYHDEDDGPLRCPHCHRIAVLEWHPPVLEEETAPAFTRSPILQTVAIAFAALILFVGGCVPCPAMDRFAALSQVETGDNDHIVGASNEISRFQITPHEWFIHTRLPLSAADNPFTALTVAQLIMAERIRSFEVKFHRAPTDFEFYVLWNRPADIRNQKPKTRDRAQRFANLCQIP